jgi:hypothetical protein
MSVRGAFRVPGDPNMAVEPFWDQSKGALHRRLWLPQAPGLVAFNPGLYGVTSVIHHDEVQQADWAVDAVTAHDKTHREMVQKSMEAAAKNAAKREACQLPLEGR